MSISLPTTPQSLTQILKSGGQIWKATLIPTFIIYIIMFGVGHLTDIYQLMYPESIVTPTHQPPTNMLVITVILLLINVFFALSLYGSIIFRMNNIVKSKDLDLGSTLTYGFKRFFPILGVIILLALGTFVGFVILIIPGIIFLIYYSFAPFFVIFGEGVIESMQESSKLVKNHWWRTLAVVILSYIPFLLLFAAIFVIFLMTNVNAERFNVLLDNIPKIKLVFYNVLAFIFILIPLSHFVYSVLLAYFYDLQNRKKYEPQDHKKIEA